MDGSAILDFLKVVVGAGLGSGVASVGLAWWKHKSDATYLALRLAVIFEGYARVCASMVSANKHPEHQSGQELPDWILKVPVLPELPTDPEGWKALNADQASACLNFAAEIRDAQSVIDALYEHAPHELGDHASEEAARLGLKAWEIATALRTKHGLQLIVPRFGFVPLLQQEIENARIRAEDARQEALEWSLAIAQETETDAAP